jgi:hypothetical protein
MVDLSYVFPPTCDYGSSANSVQSFIAFVALSSCWSTCPLELPSRDIGTEVTKEAGTRFHSCERIARLPDDVRDRKTGYSLTRRSNISQAGPSLDERGRHARVPSTVARDDERRTGHKKPISRSAASRTSDYRIRLQFVGKIWEGACRKAPRDLSMLHYSRGGYANPA